MNLMSLIIKPCIRLTAVFNRGKAGQGGAWLGSARHGAARRGGARQGWARQGKARQGMNTSDDTVDEIWDEIRRQYSDELRQLVDAAVASCDSNAMDRTDAAMLIMIPLLCEAAVASQVAGINGKQFLQLCEQSYKALQERCIPPQSKKPH